MINAIMMQLMPPSWLNLRKKMIKLRKLAKFMMSYS